MANNLRKYFGKASKVFYGAVVYNRANSAKPGTQITLETVLKDYGVIATASGTDVAASQSVTGGAAGVVNGTLAVSGIATFVTPRNVVAAWTTTSVLTVTGTDEYGSIISESSASGTSFTGKKAFKTITSFTFSISVTGATLGSGVVIGLPQRVDTGGLINIMMNNAATTGTFVAADTTSPATATTGDTRGTFSFTTAPNSSNRYGLFYKIADVETKIGTYGVLQFGSTDGA